MIQISPPPLLLIAGPTASGKSALALSLAKHWGDYEIINADSLQVYEPLPCLTARPLPEAWDGIPHHLYGEFSAIESCDVGWWLSRVAQLIPSIHARQKKVMIVGGTGLYLSALITGLAIIPEIPSSIREDVRGQAESMNLETLQSWAHHLDPDGPVLHDRQRLLRAIEVILSTGNPLRFFQGKEDPVVKEYRTITLLPPRDILYARINERFQTMVAQGALEEVKAFLPHLTHPRLSPTLKKAIGLRELMAYLQGQLTLDEAMARASQATRNYAKRQMTWLRHRFPQDILITNEADYPMGAR